MAFVENLSLLFADFGAAATLNGVAVRGLLDLATDVWDGQAATQSTSYLLPTGSTPVVGQVLITGGISYTVRQVLAEPPDGALQRLILVRA